MGVLIQRWLNDLSNRDMKLRKYAYVYVLGMNEVMLGS